MLYKCLGLIPHRNMQELDFSTLLFKKIPTDITKTNVSNNSLFWCTKLKKKRKKKRNIFKLVLCGSNPPWKVFGLHAPPLQIFQYSSICFFKNFFFATPPPPWNSHWPSVCEAWIFSGIVHHYRKPRLYEQFFAYDGDAIFSKFVASPACSENHECSHPCASAVITTVKKITEKNHGKKIMRNSMTLSQV